MRIPGYRDYNKVPIASTMEAPASGPVANQEVGPTVTKAQPHTQQQPIVVIVQAPETAGTTTSNEDQFKKFFPKRTIMIISVMMVVAGALSSITQICLIVKPYQIRYTKNWWSEEFAKRGQGIWCGVFFLATGGLGLVVAQRPTQCRIITLMVFSILSACMTIPHMALDGLGAHIAYDYFYDGQAVALFCVLFFLGLKACIVSIIISTYTCRAVRCRRVKASETVMYKPASAALLHTIPPLGNMADLSKVVAKAQNQVNVVQQQPEQQQPPAYNSVAQMYNILRTPATVDNKDTGTQEFGKCGKLKPDADSPTGGDEYKRFY